MLVDLFQLMIVVDGMSDESFFDGFETDGVFLNKLRVLEKHEAARLVEISCCIFQSLGDKNKNSNLLRCDRWKCF